MKTHQLESDGVTTVRSDAETALIRWSAIFGGLIMGLGLLMVLSSLWFALAFGSEVTEVRENLAWFIGGSAVLALFVASILTGSLSGVRGAGTGMLHGFALWALLLVITLTIGIPSILNVFNLDGIVDEATTGLTTARGETALWVSFGTIVAGFVAAGIGGAIGGAISRGRVAKRRNRTVVLEDDDDATQRATQPATTR